MALKDQISAAIVAHSVWKTKLYHVIETGILDTSIEMLRRDDQCAFGQWLLSMADAPEMHNNIEYIRIRALHTDFHHAAAKVAELALQGHKNEAEKLLDVRGEYTEATTALVLELRAWAKKIGA